MLDSLSFRQIMLVEAGWRGAKSKVSNQSGNKHVIIHKVGLGLEMVRKKNNIKHFMGAPHYCPSINSLQRLVHGKHSNAG